MTGRRIAPQHSTVLVVRACHLSPDTGSRRRFFRVEWNLAIDEAQMASFSDEQAFLLPVVIDDMTPTRLMYLRSSVRSSGSRCPQGSHAGVCVARPATLSQVSEVTSADPMSAAASSVIACRQQRQRIVPRPRFPHRMLGCYRECDNRGQACWRFGSGPGLLRRPAHETEDLFRLAMRER